jgi:hypothetical protein
LREKAFLLHIQFVSIATGNGQTSEMKLQGSSETISLGSMHRDELVMRLGTKFVMKKEEACNISMFNTKYYSRY